ncbi:hypothetical protein HN51_055559, partial [Arachis hypogaea]
SLSYPISMPSPSSSRLTAIISPSPALTSSLLSFGLKISRCFLSLLQRQRNGRERSEKQKQQAEKEIAEMIKQHF